MRDYPASFIVPNTTSVPHRLVMLEDLVELGSKDPRVVDLANRALRNNPADPLSELLNALHQLVEFTPDCGDGTCEQFQRAEHTLFDRGKGDCDDMAVAYSAMARAIRFASRVVWIDQPDKPNNHVASQACAPIRPASAIQQNYAAMVHSNPSSPTCGASHGWTWIETTLPGAMVGEHPYTAAKRLGVIRDDIS